MYSKTKKIVLLWCVILVPHLSINAQGLLQFSRTEKPSFKQMQRDFAAWKDTSNLQESKNWKYIKRWEADMQMHTDAQGEPTGFYDYTKILIESAAQNENAQRSGVSNYWLPAGPYQLPTNLTGYMQNGMGRVNCIAFDPINPSIFYVGVAQGGLWKTADNGQTYTPLTDDLPITRISDIAIDPVNPNIIYISVCDFEYIGVGLFLDGRKRHTHYGIGVYKSIDGGVTWAPTGLSFSITDGDVSLIRSIVIDPANTNSVVACGVSGIYKSTNAGVNWTLVHDSLFWDLIQDPVTPTTLYAASGWVLNANMGSAGIYKSTDFGSTWTLLNTGIPARGSVQRIKLAQSASNPSIIYALTVDSLKGMYGIYKTNNAGNTWTLKYNTLNLLGYDEGFSSGGQGTYDVGFLVHPTNSSKVYVGGVNLWASDDGATTFDPAGYWTSSYGPSIHADVHQMKSHPSTGQIYLCCDGGVYRTNNIISSTWNDLNNGNLFQTVWFDVSDGMNVTSFYRLSSSKTTSDELVAGAQDNATFYFDGFSWSTVNGGDGMDNVMDTAFTGTFIASSQFGNFSNTWDGGLSFGWMNPNVNNENAEWTTPIIADNNQYPNLYAGFENVVKSTDGGMTWTAISNLPPTPNFYGNELSAIAIANSNSNVMVAARRVRYEFSNPGQLFRTSNGGGSWTDITAGLPDSLYYTSVEIALNNANTIYVSMAGLTNGLKVFKSTNGGQAWSNISYNLPNIPINCIKQIPGSDNLMLASDIGVYVLNFGSTLWSKVSNGLPNVIVSDIEFNPAVNKIYISTFGRGIWYSDLSSFTGINTAYSTSSQYELHPTLNQGTFAISSSLQHLANIEIYDIKGRQVYQGSWQGKKQEYQLDLPNGLYFAKIQSEKRLDVKKFVVEKK
ncbi:MAG: T9SS type A sorting domain-containing protein [Bacteroidetes bacterium]|nr:T9SS type A sorting domain-containing protein [Bacteroidota bacterium]